MRDISKAAKLVLAYVQAEAAEIGENDAMPGIYVAVLQAISEEEAADLGAALLCRNESLADASFKFGRAMYDPRLQALAGALGWSA